MRWRFFRFAAGVPLLALAACGGNGGALNVALIGDRAALHGIAQGGGQGAAGRLLAAATREGLVGFDAEGRVVSALADRWIVTDDGQSYIFRLRDGKWPDGRAINAEAAAEALSHAIAAQRGTPLGIELAVIEQVRVMAGRVIEIDLKVPQPDFLTLLAQPELGLPYGKRGAGPMTIRVRGSGATLALLPPEQRGVSVSPDAGERDRAVAVELGDAENAVARFNAGSADLVLGGTVDTLPQAGGNGLTRGNLQLDPVIGLFGLMIESGQGMLADPANREALAMAIDRDALVKAFNLGGWAATTRLVGASVPDAPTTLGERWGDLDLAARQAAAAARIRRWAAGGRALPVLRVAIPGGPGSQLVIGRLREDWGALGLTVRPVVAAAPAEIRLIDVTARTARSDWFLAQLACLPGRAVCSREGDAALAAAQLASDPQRAAELLAAAEAKITAANGYIPLARPLRWSLVRGSVTGFAVNPLGWHPLPPLAALPR